MRQCEFKKRYDPEMDMHVGKHIYGEGITDIFKSVGRKLFGKTAKSMAKKAAKTAATTAATKTVSGMEYAGKKAGDKIVKLLSKNQTPRESTPDTLKQIEESMASIPSIAEKSIPTAVLKKAKELTPYEINERVNQILSGGKLRRRNFI